MTARAGREVQLRRIGSDRALIYPAIGWVQQFLRRGAIAPVYGGCGALVVALVDLMAALKWDRPRPIAADMEQHTTELEQRPVSERPRTRHRAILLALTCAGAIVVLAALTDPRLLSLMLVGGVLAAMARGRS